MSNGLAEYVQGSLHYSSSLYRVDINHFLCKESCCDAQNQFYHGVNVTIGSPGNKMFPDAFNDNIARLQAWLGCC